MGWAYKSSELWHYVSLKISQSNFRADMHCDEQISVYIALAEWSVLLGRVLLQ